MNILIDIGHPAHVHMFRNFAQIMEQRGHCMLFSCRDKEFTIQLLKKYKFNFVPTGKKYKSTLGKIFGMFKFDIKELRICQRFKPDVIISRGSPYAAHAAWLTGKPHITFEHTYNTEQTKLYEPFTDVVFTEAYDHPCISKKEIRLDCHYELAYLNRKYFSPKKDVLQQIGLTENEQFVIMRFVSWQATHDRGHSGVSAQNKLDAVKQISQYSKILISAEGELPEELEKYRLRLDPAQIHDVMAYASLIYGDSSTMAVEGAMLGIPAIYFNNNSTYHTKQLERDNGLILNLDESDEAARQGITKAIEILTNPKSSIEYKQQASSIQDTTVDVTSFLVWFFENYPESKKIITENPDFQYNFK